MPSKSNINTTLLRTIPAMVVAILLAATLFTDCKKQEQTDTLLPRLEAIEAISDQFPDSAYTLLEAIDTASMTSPASHALYHLLATKHNTGKNQFDANDYKINQSILYYTEHDNTYRLANAYLYNARRLYISDSLPQAMMNILDGLDVATDDFTIGKLNNLAADIYLSINNVPKELEYRKIALEKYSSANKPLHYDYCLTALVASLINNKKFEEARITLKNNTLKSEPVDNRLLAELTSDEGLCALQCGNRNEAKHFLLKALKLDSEYVSSLAYRSLAEIYLHENKTDSCIMLLSAIPALYGKDISYYHGMANYYSYIGNPAMALSMTDSMSTCQNIEVEKTLTHEFAASMEKYRSDKERIAKEKYKEKLYIVIMSAFLLIMTVLAVVLFFRARNRKRIQAIEATTSALSGLASAKEKDNLKLKAELAAKDEKLELAKKVMAESEYRYQQCTEELRLYLKNRHSVFNKLCSEYFTHDACSQNGKTAIYNKLKKEIDSIASTKSINGIKEEVNNTYDGVLIKLKEVFNLKESEITFLALTIAGFSAPIICYITDITPDNFYKKRSRYAAKFKLYTGEHSEAFRKIFGID